MSVRAIPKVELDPDLVELARVFRVLSRPRRLALLTYLAAAGEANNYELARAIGIGEQEMSRLLKAWGALGLIASRRQSNRTYHRPQIARITRALEAVFDLLHPTAGPGEVGESPSQQEAAA